MPSPLYDLVRMTTPTTGAANVVALGAAMPGFLTFAQAGVPDGATVSIAIFDAGGSPVQGLTGQGVYSLAGQNVTITTIRASTNSGAMIPLSGSAQIAISPGKADIAVPPASATAGDLAIFADSSGKVLADGGVIPTVLPPPGRVTMSYSVSAEAWVVWKPDGSILSTAGTTTTGLQEAINYAQANGYPLVVEGPGMTTAGVNVALIECTTPVTVSPIENWCMRVFGAIIDFPVSAAMAGLTCLTIGTAGYCSIDFDCTVQCTATCAHIVQMVNNGTAQPSSLPYVQNDYIRVRTVTSYGGTQTSVVNFDAVTKAIQNLHFKSESVDSGGFAGVGVNVTNPTGGDTSGFVQNKIEINLVANSQIAEVQIGTSTVSDPLGANIWIIGGLTPSHAGVTAALITYAKSDTYIIGSISQNGGSVSQGVFFGTGSAQNFLYCGQNDIDPAVTDDGTQNTWNVGGTAGGTLNVLGGAGVYMPGISTTASAANTFVNVSSTPANQLLRSTSSRRYKTDIEALDPAVAAQVLKLRPVQFRSLAKADDPRQIFAGLIAEEVAELLPQFTGWSIDPATKQKRPEHVEYDRLVVPLILLAREQDRLLQDQAKSLQDHSLKIAALERAVAARPQ